MSRIHEALLRAEQQRTQTVADAPLPPAAPTAALAADDLIESVASVAVPKQDAVAPDTPLMGADPISSKSLLANCVRTTWAPEPIHGLFLKGGDDHALGMEEFRTLRTRLARIREKRPLKTLLVASGMPAEGKSFVSANLSQVLSRQYGRRVLLIDGDLRRSRLHRYLGAPEGPGLVDYLTGEATEQQIIQVGPDERLFFIPGGKEVINPAELLSNGRLKNLLDRLGHIFDWIVIDSPPAVGVSDAALMAALVDGIILVIESGRTDKTIAERARQEFKDRPLLGVILNRVSKLSTGVSSYYYGRYGYYGGYGKNGKKKEAAKAVATRQGESRSES